MSNKIKWNDHKKVSDAAKKLQQEEQDRSHIILMSDDELSESSILEQAENLDDSSPLVSTLDMSIRLAPLLTAEEEPKLIKAMRSGNKAESMRARDLLVRSNSRIVIAIASKYANTYNCEFADLFQSGMEGLLRALNKFDPERGNRILTYAYAWIEQYIARAAANSPTVHIPDNKLTLLSRIKSLRKKIMLEQQRYPTSAEIAAALGVDRKEVDTILLFAESTLRSFDGQVSDDNDTQISEVTNGGQSPFDEPEDTAVNSVAEGELSSSLQALLGKVLSRHPKEHLVLNLRFGLAGYGQHTLEQTAGELGVSRERIRQLENKAIERLRGDARSKNLLSFLR